MASSTHIEGSLPAQGGSPAKGIVFARGWAVEYDWPVDRATAGGQPTRLTALKFPVPFDRDLEGALRGRERFSEFLYLFKGGQYLRIREAAMAPDGPPAGTAGAWDLPAHWTSLDAVFPGAGKKSGFAYFFRGAEYCRYEWATDKRSPGYPKNIAVEWHTPPPFTADFDGAVVGQGAFNTKAYLFKTVSVSVGRAGARVPDGTPGSFRISAPIYARYDFDAEATESVVTDPAEVVRNWKGLLPLLDAGAAVDTALGWCAAGLTAVAAPATVGGPLAHHFMNATPNPAQLSALSGRLTVVSQRINSIPDRFQWTPGLSFAAQTSATTLTEIGDDFSIFHGPNGRAAVMVHEAVHFTETGAAAIDVPEWSGETVNGTLNGVDSLSGRVYHTISTGEALTNPSSYAAFGQEVALHTDARFGAARPHE